MSDPRRERRAARLVALQAYLRAAWPEPVPLRHIITEIPLYADRTPVAAERSFVRDAQDLRHAGRWVLWDRGYGASDGYVLAAEDCHSRGEARSAFARGRSERDAAKGAGHE